MNKCFIYLIRIFTYNLFVVVSDFNILNVWCIFTKYILDLIFEKMMINIFIYLNSDIN